MLKPHKCLLCIFYLRCGNIAKVNTRKGESVLSVPYSAVDPKVFLPIRPIKASVLPTVISMIVFSNSNSSNITQAT